MNYYIQGNAARAEEIKAAFNKLGISIGGYDFSSKDALYFTYEAKGETYMMSTMLDSGLDHIILTHPDYKELELPVKPNFKVGDWAIDKYTDCVFQISKILDNSYEITERSGYVTSRLQCDIEDNSRLWSTQDAKDGDVLVTTKIRSCPFIYRKADKEDNLAYYYAGIDGNGDFCEGYIKRTLSNFGPVADVVPATKEQRDQLLAKMKEAGYTWDEKKKELRKIIEPKFKAGDDIKTGNTIETIAEVSLVSRSYCCESGRTIWFENQDLWHLVPKPHYDIANFYVGMPVLVRPDNDCSWDYSVFSRITDNEYWKFSVCNGVSFTQCIPFNEETEHLLGTTDMCDEQYINW